MLPAKDVQKCIYICTYIDVYRKQACKMMATQILSNTIPAETAVSNFACIICWSSSERVLSIFFPVFLVFEKNVSLSIAHLTATNELRQLAKNRTQVPIPEQCIAVSSFEI